MGILTSQSLAQANCLGSISKWINKSGSLKSYRPESKRAITKKELIEILEHSKLNETYTDSEKLFSLIPANAEREIVESYLYYTMSIPDVGKRNIAIERIEALFKKSARESKEFKKFWTWEKRIRKKSIRISEGQIEKHKKKGSYTPGLERKIRSEAYRNHRYNYYACRSSYKNDIRDSGSKFFKKFTVWSGLGVSLAGYTYHNRDREKDARFYGQFFIGMLSGVFKSHVSAGIMARNGSSISAWLTKGWNKWLFSRGYKIPETVVFNYLFDDSDNNLEERAKKIFESDDRQEELLKLKEYLKSQKFFMTWKYEFKKLFKELQGKIGFDYTPAFLPDDVNWENLTIEDLDDPRVSELLFLAIIAQAYDEHIASDVRENILTKDDWHLTGDVGVDRYAFLSGMGLALLPRDVAFQYYIFHTICDNQHNKKLAYLKAASAFILNRVIMDAFFFSAQREMINQPLPEMDQERKSK